MVAGLSYTQAEVIAAVRHEMATSIDDVLERRTRAHHEHRDAAGAAAPALDQPSSSAIRSASAERTRQLDAYLTKGMAERAALDTP